MGWADLDVWMLGWAGLHLENIETERLLERDQFYNILNSTVEREEFIIYKSNLFLIVNSEIYKLSYITGCIQTQTQYKQEN